MISGLFVIGGIINAIKNTPFIKYIGNDTKRFLINKITNSGGKQNILNIIEIHRDSFSTSEELSN